MEAQTVRQLERRVAPDVRTRLDTVVEWIGRPEGRGRLRPMAPELDVERSVDVWEADGQLGSRRLRTLRHLGSGLAGTVYLVEDEEGRRYAEKHYGEVSAEGGHGLGQRLASWLFALFRQAPLSFRELPEAVVAVHLINRFIVSLSAAGLGYVLTPPIAYTRYDERTGGYVHAFPFVEGRPPRPWRPGLPILGEAGRLLPTMRRWRDFLAKELGLWGLARQVDPANPNSYSNVWITPDRHVLLLDTVPGLPGFLEPRYLWWGLARGDFPPFGDAIDFERLESYLRRHGDGDPAWDEDLALLKLAVEQWRASEPRLCSSPARPLQVVRDGRVRRATRVALLRHLEVKGAVSATQARAYRSTLAETGAFPGHVRHALLKMAPLPVHLALTDGAYARALLRRSWRLPLGLARKVGRVVARFATGVGRFAATTFRLLVDRDARLARWQTSVEGWIADEEALGRLTVPQAASLRAHVRDEGESADLAGLFVVHLGVSALKHSLLGPTGVWLALALATGNPWWAAPAAVAPTLRVAAALWLGLGRRLGLLVLCALPDVGVLAAPIYLLKRKPELGGFIIRSLAARAASRVPGFGARGALIEVVAVIAVQVLLIDPARMLPVIAVAALLGVVKHWLWISWGSLVVYGIAVAWALARRWRASREEGTDISLWPLGLPERGAPPVRLPAPRRGARRPEMD
jgi:hypothetical protein